MTGIERRWQEQDDKRRLELVSRAAVLRHELAAIERELFPHRQWQQYLSAQNAGMGGMAQGSYWTDFLGGIGGSGRFA